MAMISLFVNVQNNIILESLKAQHHNVKVEYYL